jgi:hypothetical protein
MVSPQSLGCGFSISFLSGGDDGGWGWMLCGCAQGPRGLSLYFSFFLGSLCTFLGLLTSGFFQSWATYAVISNYYANGNVWFLKKEE